LAVDLNALDKTKSTSRQHASVSENGGSFTIQRIAENNTASVDGTSIGYLSPVPLRHGSEVRLGALSLKFHIEDNPDWTPPEEAAIN
jgi:predicted component of type VI protein secretion system